MNPEFIARAAVLARWINARDNFAVIYNYDADGISAGAIICKSLERLGKAFSTKPLKQLYREEIERLHGEFPDAENFIFVDFGSGQKNELQEIFAKWAAEGGNTKEGAGGSGKGSGTKEGGNSQEVDGGKGKESGNKKDDAESSGKESGNKGDGDEQKGRKDGSRINAGVALGYIIIDHHQPTKEVFGLELNPLLFGVDGGNEISAAGTSFLVARELGVDGAGENPGTGVADGNLGRNSAWENPAGKNSHELRSSNDDLSALAIVGACGDVQDGSGGLIGANAEIVKIAERAGVLKKEIDLRLYGRMTRPLIQFLQFSSSPIIPNLTANEQNCVKFITGLGIPLKNNERWRSYDGLLPDEKKALSSALIVHLHSFNVPEWKLKDLIGEVYTLVNERPGTALRDAKEYGTLLNACGRHKMAEIGLNVCMGDRGENMLMASSLLLEHRRQLSEGIRLMQEEGLREFENFYFFDAGERIKDSIIGIVAGMLYGSGTISPTKPIVALSRVDENFSKASGRATKDLVLKGLNLGKIFK